MWMTLNLQIFRVYNSCNRNEFKSLLDSIIESGNIEKVFTQKRYLWNWIRPRDFYKMISFYIVDKLSKVDDTKSLNDAGELIHIILETTKDLSIRKSFIWSIMKQVPLLNIDTIQYASPEKIQNLLNESGIVYYDEYIAPFLRVIKDLKEQVKMYQSLSDTTID